ncbi:dinitrogenase iron-molybdenum cofactor biosynthesis protein [Candidatus Fermentibacteria bacterium]|nr:dinitrogenase iron-molybdenum cofactor biosynthesis protein [Candidatus Fermentibacteria bacterium]
MKVAVTSTGRTLDDKVDPRFGRSPYFLLVDTDNMKAEALQNPNAALGGGAGIQAAQLMSEQEVKVVLTGNCGPNAFRTLQAAGIEVVSGVSGTVRRAVEDYVSGEYSSSNAPNVADHFGAGGGRGGMGMGRGAPPPPPRAEESHIDALKAEVSKLEQTLQKLEERLSKLEGGDSST